jgi:putative endonuclease
MFYVYVIVNSAGKHYYGYTSNLRERIRQHQSHHSRYTAGDEWKLVYYEAFLSKEDARRRERKLKDGGQSVRHLKDRIKDSISLGCAELSAGLKAPSRREGR